MTAIKQSHMKTMKITYSYLAMKPTVKLYPSYVPRPVHFKTSLCVRLYVLVSVTELCNQDVQHYNEDNEQKTHHQYSAYGSTIEIMVA